MCRCAVKNSPMKITLKFHRRFLSVRARSNIPKQKIMLLISTSTSIQHLKTHQVFSASKISTSNNHTLIRILLVVLLVKPVAE